MIAITWWSDDLYGCSEGGQATSNLDAARALGKDAPSARLEKIRLRPTDTALNHRLGHRSRELSTIIST